MARFERELVASSATGKAGGRLDLVDLLGVACVVGAEQQQPLVAVEQTEGVVPAKRVLGIACQSTW
jgi:hypothetical protein